MGSINDFLEEKSERPQNVVKGLIRVSCIVLNAEVRIQIWCIAFLNTTCIEDQLQTVACTVLNLGLIKIILLDAKGKANIQQGRKVACFRYIYYIRPSVWSRNLDAYQYCRRRSLASNSGASGRYFAFPTLRRSSTYTGARCRFQRRRWLKEGDKLRAAKVTRTTPRFCEQWIPDFISSKKRFIAWTPSQALVSLAAHGQEQWKWPCANAAWSCIWSGDVPITKTSGCMSWKRQRFGTKHDVDEDDDDDDDKEEADKEEQEKEDYIGWTTRQDFYLDSLS